MSEITLIGLNHKTASVKIREALAFTAEEITHALQALNSNHAIKESMIFSTCNRMEILFIPNSDEMPNIPNSDEVPNIPNSDEVPNGIESIINFLSQYKKIPVSHFKDVLYIYSGNDAVKHLFRVASSLDSMILGEPQILGQVKSAYRVSIVNKSSGVIINRLMHKAFSIAKKVRRETGIGDNAVSISYAAIELANKIFSDLSERRVMLLGAGEMAELAVEHLISHGVKKIVVANRTFENAVALAEKVKGKAIKFEEREEMLQEVDIIVSSTGATEYIITTAQVKKTMSFRKNRPLFFIDIAVPRDIDPEVNKINNAYLYDIDDLQNIVDENMDERKKEAVKAERLVEEAVIKFQKWLKSLDVVPTIVAIREKIDKITELEIEKTLGSLKNLSVEEQESIKRMTRAITSKIMHDPIKFLKNRGNHRDNELYLNAAREMFNINQP